MNRKSARTSIAEQLRTQFNEFKPAERKIATHLLNNYPMAGMVSITELSKNSEVSTPTVMRMLKRIGYTSFISFQKALKKELSKTLADPIEKHGLWARGTPREHILNQVADAAVENLRNTLKHISHQDFNAVVELLSAPKKAVHLVGGRITHTFADYMCTHLEVVRSDVHRLPQSSSLWPHHMLEISRQDVLVIFDVRRYEADTFRLAELAHSKGVIVVLFTDQWLSPIVEFARYSFPVRTEAPSGWDSGGSTLFLVEALITAIEKKLWRRTSARMKELEKMFDYTGRFS